MDKKTISTIGAFLGFVVILLFALELAAPMFGISFQGMDDVLTYFNAVQTYLVYALAGLAGLEFVAEKKLLGLIFFIILAFVIIATFFNVDFSQYIPA